MLNRAFVLFSALAVASVSSGGIVKTTGSLSSGANALDTSRDLILGKLPLSVVNTKMGQEGCNKDGTVLTDGIADNTKPYADHVYSIGSNTSIIYSLGDNATGYAVDEIICHFGWGDTGRANSSCIKIRYALVAAPDSFVDAGITASAGGSGSNNYVKYTFDQDDVLMRVCKIELTVSHSSYGGVIEFVVNGTECEPTPYLELDDFQVSNTETRSPMFFNGSEIALPESPSVVGAEKWTRQDVFDFEALAEAEWSGIGTFPTSFSVPRPAIDADISVWYWFDSNADGYIKRVARTKPIRFTTAKPILHTVDSISRFTRAGTVRLEASECDAGTTGGTSSGEGLETLEIPVWTNLLELVSGPGPDLDPDPSVVTVDQTGSYLLRFISINTAGNPATNEIPYSVGRVPVGETFTWTGAQSSDWHTPGNWDRNCYPIATDNLVIPAGCPIYPVLNPIDHPRDGGAYGSLSVDTGASITFASDTAFVNEASGGTAAKPHGRGPALACGSAEINGKLTADNLGFPRGKGPSSDGDMAGHGNAGCIEYLNKTRPNYQTFGRGIVAYGDPTQPTALGSGGAYGAGGGAIKLVCTGDLTLDGSITASSTTRGAGGSIWLVCGGAFSGSGSVLADSTPYGDRSGAGGRIAIYHSSSSFTGVISAIGHWTANNHVSIGGVGTLYEPGRYPLGTAESPATVAFDGGFNYVFENEEPHFWNLVVTPGSRGGFKAGNLHLGDFSMSGELTYLEFGTFVPGQARDMQTLVFDSITLSDSSILRLPGGYNGARQFTMSSLSIGPNARLNTGFNDWSYSDEAHGGSASAPLGRGVELTCEQATIEGVLSVSYQGYGYGYGPNPTTDYGSGHGGCTQAPQNIGQTGYGSFCSPTTLGCCYKGDGVCFGGGAIRLMVSDSLALTGTIEANANGRGSGGSIWIAANHFTGNGVLAAKSYNSRRPGAGGRIAVESVDDQFEGTISVAVGEKYSDNKSYPGTVFRSTVPSYSAINSAVGSEMLMATYEKNVFNSSVESDWDNIAFNTQFVIRRQIEKCKRSAFVWTESCGLANGTPVANSATYKLNGLTPGARAQIKVNGEAVKDQSGNDLRVGQDGSLTFPATLNSPDNRFEVTFGRSISIFMR